MKPFDCEAVPFVSILVDGMFLGVSELSLTFLTISRFCWSPMTLSILMLGYFAL